MISGYAPVPTAWRWGRELDPPVSPPGTAALAGWLAIDRVALASLDAAKDAANRWIFPELAADGLDPHPGVTAVLPMGSNDPTHGVDVTDWLKQGVASLRCHARYIRSLGRDFDPESFLHDMTAMGGQLLGVPNAVLLERFSTTSV